MLAKRIIACLDVRDGRVVKGRKFQNLVNQGEPAIFACRYEEQGADELVLLDVSATREGRLAMRRSVRDVASVLSVPLTVGGGVRSVADAESLFKNGADKVSLNTAAVENPALVSGLAAQFGSQSVTVAIDAKKMGGAWKVFVRAGTADSGLDAVAWARQVQTGGAGEILLTSMDADGSCDGYDLPLLSAVRAATTLPLVASGGAGRNADFAAALRVADAALAAGTFHSGKINIPSLKKYLKKNKVVVRL